MYHHLLKFTSAKKINFRKCSLNWRIFLFHGKLMLCSRDIQCFVSLIIPSTVKFLTPWRVFAHERGYILQLIFCIVNHKLMKLGQLVDIAMGNIFRKWFEWLFGLGPYSRPFSIYQIEKQFLDNQVWLLFGFSLFWRCGIIRLNKVNINY